MKHISAEEFEAEVARAKVPVLVDFYTGGCGPCRDLVPILEEVERDLDGKLKVLKIDAEVQAQLAARFRVGTVPMLFLFRGGEVVAQCAGKANKKVVLAWLASEGVA